MNNDEPPRIRFTGSQAYRLGWLAAFIALVCGPQGGKGLIGAIMVGVYTVFVLWTLGDDE